MTAYGVVGTLKVPYGGSNHMENQSSGAHVASCKWLNNFLKLLGNFLAPLLRSSEALKLARPFKLKQRHPLTVLSGSRQLMYEFF